MDSNSYQVLKYHPDFEDQSIKILKHLWGPNEDWNRAYLKWKYEQNPYTNDIGIFVAFYADNLVGLLGSFGIELELGNVQTKHATLCLADMIIEPEHRNRQLFAALVDYALNDFTQREYKYVVDFSANPQAKFMMLFGGWKSLYLPTAHRQADLLINDTDVDTNEHPSPIVKSYQRIRRRIQNIPAAAVVVEQVRRIKSNLDSTGTGATLVKPFEIFDQNSQYAQRKESHIIVQSMADIEAMTDLITRTARRAPIRHVRDPEYFKWRYQNPLSDYRFLYYWSDTQLEGYLVLHTNIYANSQGAWVNIVDWEATHEQAYAELLTAVIHWGEFQELEVWMANLPDHLQRLLDRQGFFFREKSGSAMRDSEGESILIKQLNGETDENAYHLNGIDLLDLANWDMRMIFSDAY